MPHQRRREDEESVVAKVSMDYFYMTDQHFCSIFVTTKSELSSMTKQDLLLIQIKWGELQMETSSYYERFRVGVAKWKTRMQVWRRGMDWRTYKL